MRTINSMKNISMNILIQLVVTILGFVSRKIFIDSLGTEYLGVNGLLTNILSMMSLVEGGIGVSIVYNLYKPLAENNEEKISALVNLYKRLYIILAIIIFLISMIIYPFLGVLMREASGVKYIGVVYNIFVFKNIISYLNAHKWSLINADQKEYVLAKYNLIFNIITTLTKIVILLITKNYLLYLIFEVILFMIQNIWNGKIVDKKYPYIKLNKHCKVDNEVKENIFTNVKALFLHKIGTWCVFGTDNILISSLVSIKAVGLYSNYTMIIGQLSAFINPLINGIGESVGNLIATENEEKKYNIFEVTYLVNFWIYSFATIFLFNLLEPFIDWWLGNGLLLDKFTFIVILINFYFSGMRKSVLMFKAKAGIFTNDKYIPLIESAINLISSLILVKYLGLAGIFLGTTISTITIPLWTQPSLIYKKVFYKPVSNYFKKYILYAFITLTTCGITSYICSFIVASTLMGLIIRGIVCLFVPNIIYITIFSKSKEFKYIKDIIINNIYKKITNKIIINE